MQRTAYEMRISDWSSVVCSSDLFEIRQDILPWSGLLASVRAGKYDAAITGSIVSVERLRVFDFTMPTASAQHFYIKRKGDDRIKGVKDLSGLTVGVQAGSVLLSRLPEHEQMLKKTGGKLGKVVEYTSYPEIYEDLANGRLDYTVNSIVHAQDLTKTRGDAFVLGEPVTGPGFHAYPVPKGNEEQIGRASCRERGCKYGEISVVAEA